MAWVIDDRDEHDSVLEPPRFTLRSLFLGVTACGCLLALMSVVGLLWSAAIGLFLCLVLAHVSGNSVGTTLRDRASRASRKQSSERSSAVMLSIAAPQRLTQRVRLGRVARLTTWGGAMAGAMLGGTGSARLYPEAPNSAVLLGIFSLAVLGGFVGFAASSFVSVARQAMREALSGGDALAMRRSNRSR
jgi:hypothetical protein